MDTEKYRILKIILLLLLVVGIWILVYQFGTFQTGPQFAPRYEERVSGWPESPMGWGEQMRPGGFLSEPPKLDFKSEGELIYHTGYNESGQFIEFESGPGWLYMHGGSCVSCHGADGKGGRFVMMGTAIASDIRYEVLSSEAHMEKLEVETEEGLEAKQEEEEEEHPPYTEETLKRAIREGLDPAGNALDFTMPRWALTDSDLDEVVAFLKTL